MDFQLVRKELKVPLKIINIVSNCRIFKRNSEKLLIDQSGMYLLIIQYNI